VPIEEPPRAISAQLGAAEAAVHAAVATLNAAMRLAARLGLEVRLETNLQDLAGDDSPAWAGKLLSIAVVVRRY